MGGGSVRDDADGVCLHPLHAHAGRVLARVVQTNPEAVDELPGSGGERVQDGAGGHAEVQQNRQVSNQTIELFFTLLVLSFLRLRRHKNKGFYFYRLASS